MLQDWKFTVKNLEQKALFFGELQGQISDGKWENTVPTNHWQNWCSLEWNQVEVGENIGRNFWVVKDNYNLTAPDLLEVVGERMLFMVKLVHLFPEVVAPIIKKDHWMLPESLAEYNGWMTKKNLQEYEIDQMAKLAQMGFTWEMAIKADTDNTYTMKEMKKDLTELKKAFKTMVR